MYFCAQLRVPSYNCKIILGTPILGLVQRASVVAQLWPSALPTFPGLPVVSVWLQLQNYPPNRASGPFTTGCSCVARKTIYF